MAHAGSNLQVIAIDCGEPILSALRQIPSVRLNVVSPHQQSLSQLAQTEHEIDLFVIGLAPDPLRQALSEQLRSQFPSVPMLMLRRSSEKPTQVRGEFLLSDQTRERDYGTVEKVRQVFPLSLETHSVKDQNQQLAREVFSLIARDYADPALNLARIARELSVSPRRLSQLLNQQAGIGFRQLLSQTRVEQAKQLLVSGQYSVKEVAAQVGFADSHYFSRSFKQFTGVSPSTYRLPLVLQGERELRRNSGN